MDLIGVIPARGGSKGIPKKNIVSCAGKPLLAYTAAAAMAARGLSRVILSTDDRDIAQHHRDLRAKWAALHRQLRVGRAYRLRSLWRADVYEGPADVPLQHRA